LIAQVIKVVEDSVRQRHLDFRRLATAGGMPSSHTALVLSLTTVIGSKRGINSPEFAISVIFSAVGDVRRHRGASCRRSGRLRQSQQARLLAARDRRGVARVT